MTKSKLKNLPAFPALPGTETASENRRRPKLSKSRAQLERWADIREGRRPDPREADPPGVRLRKTNPLIPMPADQQKLLLSWHRKEIPHENMVEMMREHAMPEASVLQVIDFLEYTSAKKWRIEFNEAALHANELVRIVKESGVNFPEASLVAFGQEAFRLISSHELDPESLGRLTLALIRTRGDIRAEQLHAFRQEKLRRELQDQVDHALERLCEEVEEHPQALEAFDALKEELAHTIARAHEGEDANKEN